MIRRVVRTAVRGLGVGCATGVELLALSVWLGLSDDAELTLADGIGLSLADLVGVAALAAGLLLAGLLTHLVVNGRRYPVPAAAVGALVVAETAVWVGWLAVAEWLGGVLGVVLAGVVLAGGLLVLATVTDSVLRGREPLATLVGRNHGALAVVETVGATAWLLVVSGLVAVPDWFFSVPVAGFEPRAVVGAALLGAALFAQRLLAVRLAMRTARRRVAVGWRSSQGTVRE
ncbi:hypothetical protein [Halorussus halophilus]|uniref:hypothetical protein n=1 Tax=Halorussus halophilus TaxID=2650975 RepID=UPI0013012B3D|nr:hypothetical protein [Halorussus halophilus]